MSLELILNFYGLKIDDAHSNFNKKNSFHLSRNKNLSISLCDVARFVLQNAFPFSNRFSVFGFLFSTR